MSRSENEAPSGLPPEELPDPPEDPIKPSDSPAKTQPEVPKTGTTDAPGG